MGVGALAPALQLWLQDWRVKPIVYDERGNAYYLLGRCVECAIEGRERYLYEDKDRDRRCFSVEQIVALTNRS